MSCLGFSLPVWGQSCLGSVFLLGFRFTVKIFSLSGLVFLSGSTSLDESPFWGCIGFVIIVVGLNLPRGEE